MPLYQTQLQKAARGTVVILGSSGAAGLGSSGYTTDPGLGGVVSATSWAGLWGAELTGQGFVVSNVSVSGTGTQQSIDRFVSDVVPKNPTHVVLCTNPTNDNFNAAPQSASRIYVANSLKLARMTANIGAVPILGMGIYPNSSWTAVHLSCARWMLRQFEESGYTTVNLIDALLDTVNSRLIAGYASDGLHLQDPGQAAQFSAIPPTVMQAATIAAGPAVAAYAKFARLGGADTTPGPIQCNLTRAADSWTLAVRLHGNAGIPAARTFMFLRDAANAILRVRNPSSVYEISDSNNTVLATTAVNPTTDTTPHTLILTKHRYRGEIKFYLDGAQVGSTVTVSPSIAVQQTGFDVLGRIDNGATGAINCGVSAVGFWRCAFTNDVVADIAAGYWPQAGAEVLTDKLLAAPVCAFPNRAKSVDQLICASPNFSIV